MFLPKPHLLLLLLIIPKHHLLVLHLTERLFQLQHQILLLLLLFKNTYFSSSSSKTFRSSFLSSPSLQVPFDHTLPHLLHFFPLRLLSIPLTPLTGTHATSFLFFLLLLPKHHLLFLHLPLLKFHLLLFLRKHHFLFHLLLLLHPWLLLPLQNP